MRNCDKTDKLILANLSTVPLTVVEMLAREHGDRLYLVSAAEVRRWEQRLAHGLLAERFKIYSKAGRYWVGSKTMAKIRAKISP